MLENLNFYFNYFGLDFGSEILNPANMFMILVALFWMLIGSIQDFRKREVENWWNFSLIAFILAFRAFLAIETSEGMYFSWGIIGLVAGFLLCNVFYYARMFAGGDAKLMMALGTILPLSLDWKTNLLILGIFLLLFLFIGALYGLLFSIFLGISHRREFLENCKKLIKENRGLILIPSSIFAVAGISFLILGQEIIGFLFWVIAALPFLFIYAKSIEESCLTKEIAASELTIGDWIAKPMRIKKGKKIILIKPYWEGLSEEELKIIRQNYKGKVIVKNGIPFVPAFFIAFAVFAYIIAGLR